MTASSTRSAEAPPKGATAVLVLADGSTFWGQGIGATGSAAAEVCFNTAMTGYQEILTDPSYAGQIITFTFPHIGNVGINAQDNEATVNAARGCVLRAPITEPSNFRATGHLNNWLQQRQLIGLAGVDTRSLTRHIRINGAPNGVICHNPEGAFDWPKLHAEARAWPGIKGMDLAREVTCRQTHYWDQTPWQLGTGYGVSSAADFHVVVVDYGVKHNILRCLVNTGARLTVVPCTSTADEILAQKPDGVFLSNGPGDPQATASYAVPAIRALLAAELPVFGICLGHQLLSLALGARTEKMHQGHHGANHPVKDLVTDKVEISCMNHGFTVARDSLPAGVTATHISLFDQSLCGLQVENKPVFSVQHHPEASPGPQDSHYLFQRFAEMIRDHAQTQRH